MLTKTFRLASRQNLSALSVLSLTKPQSFPITQKSVASTMSDGLSDFLLLTYKTSFASVLGSLTVAKYASALALAPMTGLIGGIGLSLVGIYGMNKGQMMIV